MSGQGVEIGTGSDGKIVLRDHATGEVYQYVTHLELVVDPLCRNGEDACPRLKVGVLNIARKADALPVPGGVQRLTITTPVFVEVREGLVRSPKERRKQHKKEARRENRLSKRADEALNRRELARLRREEKNVVHVHAPDSPGSETYAAFVSEITRPAESHPDLRRFVGKLPSWEPAGAPNLKTESTT